MATTHVLGPPTHSAFLISKRDLPSLSLTNPRIARSSRKCDTPERVTQALRLKTLVQSVAESGDRVVVCGDFNVNPDSKTFDVLRTLGLTDLVAT